MRGIAKRLDNEVISDADRHKLMGSRLGTSPSGATGPTGPIGCRTYTRRSKTPSQVRLSVTNGPTSKYTHE